MRPEEAPTRPPDYGIDAPGVRRGMLVAGSGGTVLTLALALIALRNGGSVAAMMGWSAVVSSLAAVYGFGMAAYMTRASRVGKLRTREHLIDLAHKMTPWTGRETVLDVGCGRGLMLVGAARRLTTGQAVGIDLWRAADQTGNGPEAAVANARCEGVADRVRVVTADARRLPFADASVDVLLSHWVVHNLPSAPDRDTALGEMVRVLRPGGTLVLADIAHHDAYLTTLAAAGFAPLHAESGGAESRIIGWLSGGSFRPRAILAQKPA